MGLGSEGRGEPCPPWIFIHNTDKAEGGLMKIFFGLVFSVGPFLEHFLRTPLEVLPTLN